jgi:hypothetical protein
LCAQLLAIACVCASLAGCASSPTAKPAANKDSKSADSKSADSKNAKKPSRTSTNTKAAPGDKSSPFVFRKRGQAPQTGAPVSEADDTGSEHAGPQRTAWTIAIATFRGEQAQRLAQQAQMQLSSQGGLNDVRIEQRAQAWLLTSGEYESPSEPRAQADLSRVQQIVPSAMLVPPDVIADRGSMPEWDLSRVRARQPDAKWTLQVGIYGHADPSKSPTDKEREEFQAAAEQAVQELRSQGDEAYYWHGPRRSTVTVGVFTERDQITAIKDPQTMELIQLPRPRESLDLVEARRRFPVNMLNGAPVMERPKGATEMREQASFLVGVPR